MRYQDAVLRSARPSPPSWEVTFEVARPPQAGQFVLADFGGPIREPLFPTELDTERFTTVLPPGHPALRLLPGTQVSLLGPAGHGFEVSSSERLLLIAETALLPYLLPLISAVGSVVVVVEAPTRATLPQPGRFAPHAELVLVTLDGSAGYNGPLESDHAEQGRESAAGRLSELLGWADCVCLALPIERYERFAQWVRQVRLHPQAGFAQAWVRVPMPCGVGACDLCRVATAYGEKRACVDGPVLNLLDFCRPTV